MNRIRSGHFPSIDLLLLAASFALILAGAIGFTNAVEWLGHRLDLGHGAVGALLAAVGTALPESTIPLVAVLGSGGDPEQEQIAIGAILGAPFMLATVAMLLVAVSARAFNSRRASGRRIEADRSSARRDLAVFLGCLPVALALGLVDVTELKVLGAVALVLAYAVYVVLTVRGSRGSDVAEEELDALFFDPSKQDPPRGLQILVQFVVSLAAIVAGAELFVGQVEKIAHDLGLEPIVLALILAPLATELPEKANSVLWIRNDKDTLALGNITGAMAFQSTLPVAFGLLVTDWSLGLPALAAGGFALAGGLVALWAIERSSFGAAPGIAWFALFAGFVMLAAL